MAPGRVVDWGSGESDSKDPAASRSWLVSCCRTSLVWVAAGPVWF